MYLFKIFLKTLVNNYIFIGLCSVFFYLSGFLFAGNKYIPDFIHISLIFWSTIAIYYFNTQDIQLFPLKKTHITNLSSISFISFILAVIIISHLFFIPFSEILFLGHLGIISILYNILRPVNLKLLPLRGIPLIKVFLIAYVWASIGITFPALQSGNSIWQYEILKLFTAEFFFIISIALPFDIRDYYSDHINEPRTLAHLLGIRHTIAVALLFLGLFTIIIWPSIDKHYLFILFIVIVAILIYYSTPHKNKYYYAVLLDGTMILYYIVLLFATK